MIIYQDHISTLTNKFLYINRLKVFYEILQKHYKLLHNHFLQQYHPRLLKVDELLIKSS